VGAVSDAVSFSLMLLGVTVFPVAALGLLLWLTHLEETLPRDVHAALRSPAPEPILAIPVRRTAEATEPVLIPVQRTAPAAELSGADGALAT
jgi:hypothetical protein